MIEDDKVSRIRGLNNWASITAIILVISLIAVGGHRATENIILHMSAANFALLFAILFQFIQCRISNMLIPTVNSLRISRIRSLVVISAVVFASLMFVTVILSANNLKVEYSHILHKSEERLLWDGSYGEYVWHCLTAL